MDKGKNLASTILVLMGKIYSDLYIPLSSPFSSSSAFTNSEVLSGTTNPLTHFVGLLGLYLHTATQNNTNIHA
jgi:hypothetical protein